MSNLHHVYSEDELRGVRRYLGALLREVFGSPGAGVWAAGLGLYGAAPWICFADVTVARMVITYIVFGVPLALFLAFCWTNPLDKLDDLGIRSMSRLLRALPTELEPIAAAIRAGRALRVRDLHYADAVCHGLPPRRLSRSEMQAAARDALAKAKEELRRAAERG